MPSPNEYAAVRAVLDNYIEGSYTANIKLLKSCFHPDALMSGFMEGVLDVGTPQPFYDELEAEMSSRDVGEAYHAEIAFIHIADPLASASIVEDNLLGNNYINHFHLMKVEGEWCMISKIYTDVT
ncbi:MAG: hypothetical protein HON65_09655 [Rhodospirillales bacterium]|jgi:hypothetical protein|nr:hypothetical protein [Rhodospirillales bacterium]